MNCLNYSQDELISSEQTDDESPTTINSLLQQQ